MINSAILKSKSIGMILWEEKSEDRLMILLQELNFSNFWLNLLKAMDLMDLAIINSVFFMSNHMLMLVSVSVTHFLLSSAFEV